MKTLINKNLNKIVVMFGIINLILVLIFEFPCPWKENFNIDCCGCGATRMFKSLLKLDFYQAFRFNPLIFSLLIVSLFYLIYIVVCKIRRKNYYKIKDRDLWILLILVIIFTILRNIPGFDYLKPTVIN